MLAPLPPCVALPVRAGGVAGLFAAYAYHRFRNRNYTGFGHADISWMAQVMSNWAGPWGVEGFGGVWWWWLGGAPGG